MKNGVCTPIMVFRTLYFSIYLTLPESFLFLKTFSLLFSISTWRISFSNSGMKCLSFCFSGKVFISPSFLKDCFTRYSIFSCQLFLLPGCPTTFWLELVLLRNQGEISWELPWKRPVLSHATFKILSLSPTWQFDYVSWHRPLWAPPCWSLELFELDMLFLPQIWRFLAIISSRKLSASSFLLLRRTEI